MFRAVFTLHDVAHILNTSRFLLMLRNVFLSSSLTPNTLLDTSFTETISPLCSRGLCRLFYRTSPSVRSSQLSILSQERPIPSIHPLASESDSPGPSAPHVPTVTFLPHILPLLLQSLDFQIQRRRRIGHVSAFTERAF